MQFRFFLSFVISILFFSAFVEAQTKQTEEIMFVITNDGDSILTTKIFKNQTYEDQITFLIDGWPKTYKADEIKSYFKKSRKYSIYVKSENQHKLARILVKGDYKLARSITIKEEEKFYIQVNNEWKNLDPHADNLKEYLSTILPGFEESTKKKKIHYDTPSLGKVISEYNFFKNPEYNILGYPSYTRSIKIGLLGSIGSSSLSSDKFDGPFDNSTGFNIGIGGKFIYTQIFSLKFQASYAKNSWKNPAATIDLGTLNFAVLGSVEIFRPSRNFGLFLAPGLNFILDLGTKIDDLSTISDRIDDLNAINLGYDFQLGASIGNRFDLFCSYQINPKLKTTEDNILGGNTSLSFKVNTIRIGANFYFINR